MCSIYSLFSPLYNTKIFVVFDFAKGDVYPVEPYEGFLVNQVLDAHWGVLDEDDVRTLSLS